MCRMANDGGVISGRGPSPGGSPGAKTWWIGALLLVTMVVCPLTAFAQTDDEIVAEIDRQIRQAWDDNKVKPSPRTEDGEFARRVSLDTVGRIPALNPLLEFLQDTSGDKRRRLVDELLDDPDYIQHWSTIWGNLLVGRSNRRNRTARDDLDKWLRQSLAKNQSYDQFAAELISATGSSDDIGAIGFLASHLNENAVPATAITARIFLGLQVQCTQCHNHPFNDAKQSQFWGLNAFFRGTRRQNVGQNNETIYMTDDDADAVVFFEKRNGTMEAVTRRFVDGSNPPTNIVAPRHQLAAMISDPSQPLLAQAYVNRMWGHFLGTGFTKPVDDMGPHNPPSHPELLDYLAKQFKASGFDTKRLIRWITASEAYNLTSKGTSDNAADDPGAGSTPLFTHVGVKPFTAEQLYDSLIIATAADQAGRNFQQSEQKRDEWLQQFVQTFGTDENDESSSFNGTVPQAFVMMNGDLVRNAISGGKGSFLRTVYDGDMPALLESRTVKKSKLAKGMPAIKTIPGKIEFLFLAALSRRPSTGELRALSTAYERAGGRDPVKGLQDVFWAILNANEFILNH